MTLLGKNCTTLKVALISIYILVSNSCNAFAELANQTVKGREIATIDDVLSMPDSEIDVGTAILIISKEGYKDLYEIDMSVTFFC